MLPQAQTEKAAYIAAHIMTFNADVSFLGLSENKANITAAIQEQLKIEARHEQVADDYALNDLGHFFEVHTHPVPHTLVKGSISFIVAFLNTHWHHVQVLSVHASRDEAEVAMDEHISKLVKEPITDSNRAHIINKLNEKRLSFSIHSCPVLPTL